ncbi:hypothetical protein ACF081_08830 [Streptomyces longwoodensis]|uniref:hypothetical protein n=1 Tax=Streptomyces longwoodensis TaxID=68231 RepID=UPI0036FF8BA9
MNGALDRFIRLYLSLEQAYDTSGYLRPTLHAFTDEYVAAVKDGLESALRTREISVEAYERLTDIEFGSEESLYDYLNRMHEYLFLGRDPQPTPPNGASRGGAACPC